MLQLYPNGHLPLLPLKNQEPLLLSQTKNQDKNATSTNNIQTHPNRIPSSHSEYSTLSPYPDSVNDSTYETPLSTTYLKPLSNMNSVDETPPESNNPLDIQLTNTPYLTPTSLTHPDSLTVK